LIAYIGNLGLMLYTLEDEIPQLTHRVGSYWCCQSQIVKFSLVHISLHTIKTMPI